LHQRGDFSKNFPTKYFKFKKLKNATTPHLPPPPMRKKKPKTSITAPKNKKK